MPPNTPLTGLSRRQWLRASGLSLLGASASGWAPALAARLAAAREPRHCVLLWMTGGPSQLDTFDPKPGHAHGGEFQAIETSVAGVRICEHLPKLARQAEHLALVRGMNTREGDHGRGTHLVHTGYAPDASVKYPAIGCSIAKQLGDAEADVPSYVSITPNTALNRAAFASGFLGPRFAPLVVGEATGAAGASRFAPLQVDDLRSIELGDESFRRRLELADALGQTFAGEHPSAALRAQQTAARRAVRMMQSQAARAFDLAREPDDVRERYGPGRFGQGCLLARRLIEAGVPMIEVALGSNDIGWDTHVGNFPAVKKLCGELDAGWSTLLDELAERGLLGRTTFLWAGEFGRTPRINNNAGRDHFPDAWSVVLGGAGIRGGQFHGRTSDDGMSVEDGQVGPGDVLATLIAALGIDAETRNTADGGRPVRLAEGTPIAELLA